MLLCSVISGGHVNHGTTSISIVSDHVVNDMKDSISESVQKQDKKYWPVKALLSVSNKKGEPVRGMGIDYVELISSNDNGVDVYHLGDQSGYVYQDMPLSTHIGGSKMTEKSKSSHTIAVSKSLLNGVRDSRCAYVVVFDICVRGLGKFQLDENIKQSIIRHAETLMQQQIENAAKKMDSSISPQYASDKVVGIFDANVLNGESFGNEHRFVVFDKSKLNAKHKSYANKMSSSKDAAELMNKMSNQSNSQSQGSIAGLDVVVRAKEVYLGTSLEGIQKEVFANASKNPNGSLNEFSTLRKNRNQILEQAKSTMVNQMRDAIKIHCPISLLKDSFNKGDELLMMLNDYCSEHLFKIYANWLIGEHRVEIPCFGDGVPFNQLLQNISFALYNEILSILEQNKTPKIDNLRSLVAGFVNSVLNKDLGDVLLSVNVDLSK